jgi:hypothetical protein
VPNVTALIERISGFRGVTVDSSTCAPHRPCDGQPDSTVLIS